MVVVRRLKIYKLIRYNEIRKRRVGLYQGFIIIIFSILESTKMKIIAIDHARSILVLSEIKKK